MLTLKMKLSYDRRSVGQSVLVSGSHLELINRFFSVLTIAGFLMWASSLTRGWICNSLVQLLLGLARAVTLESDSRKLTTIFYCLIWDSPHLEGQVPVFISPRNRVAQLFLNRSCTTHDERGVRTGHLVGKPEGKRPLWRPKRRWEYNTY
jgi:hypothetical protein